MVGDTPIQLLDTNRKLLGQLPFGAFKIITEAEQMARIKNLSKRSAIPITLREHIRQSGYKIEEYELSQAVLALDTIRAGKKLTSIQIVVHPTASDGYPDEIAERSLRNNVPMTNYNKQNSPIHFFEVEQTYPNDESHLLYDSLVGLDEHKSRLLIELEMLLYPDRLEQWSRKHHKGHILKLCKLQSNRPSLILLEGDVGTGKTALAQTIGDALARHIGKTTKVHLLKINTQVRGTGHVGEMTDLIVQAFVHAEAKAKSLNGQPVLLLLDEADALAARRDTQQMHHEDKAGLNTLLQRLDNLRQTRLPIAVIFITNRPDALDPAIRRRAALDLFFQRPNAEIRAEIIAQSVPEINLTSQQIAKLVELTGEQPSKNGGVSFTASDLTERLLAGALREAYSQDRKLEFEDLMGQATTLKPTPRLESI